MPSNPLTKQEYSRHPFLLSVDSILDHLTSNRETGLSLVKAQEGQRNYGPNKLKGEGKVQWYSVLLKQISNAMILVRLPIQPERALIHDAM